jgi:hypothetical protein
MALDGKNKRELNKDSPHLVHGMSRSPDGKRAAYEGPAAQPGGPDVGSLSPSSRRKR